MRLYVRLAVYLACAAAVIGTLAWVHHRGVVSGRDDMRPKVEQAERERDIARAQVEADARTMADITARAQAARALAAEQAEAAEVAKAEARKAKAAQSQAEALFNRTLRAATARPECAALKEQLCDSVMDY